VKLKTKVVVVGGGPAGAIAARSLAECGVEVILLERNLSFKKPCGGGVPFSAFEDLRIPKTVIEREVKCIRIVSPMGERLDIELGEGSLAMVERGKFDSALRAEAEKRGAEIVGGEFTGLITWKKEYQIVANVKGEKTEISAEYVVAADGVNSKVRAALGIKPYKSFITVSEKIGGIKTDFCEFWFGSSHAPGSYSWVFPATEGVSAGTGSSEPGKTIALLKRFKDKRGITQEGIRRIYKIPIWKGDLYNKNNVIFAGDSAGQVMPLTYEGIYYAMKAGEFAARAIMEGKTSNYKKMWDAAFHKRFYFMDKLRKYFYKNDLSAEKFVAFYRRAEVQEASIRLWLRKDSGKESIQRYIKIFRKFLCSL
jgi:geranylgeranyl reductase